MRTIHTDEITKCIKEMCMQVNVDLSPDVKDALLAGKEKEESTIGKQILEQLEKNLEIAKESQIPICQDTGMTVVFLRIGQEVHIDGGQKVKKVYVKKGDKVKKGDILLKYNVSEKELDLKLQKLQIQSSKMEIAEMEKEHIICGYHTLINWDNTSKDQLTAMIEVKVTPQRGQGFDRIAERIYNFPEVKAVYLMSGGYDFMVMLEGKTMKEISMFTSSKLAPLESVVSTVTHFVLKKYKDHGTVLEAKKVDERQAVTP